VVIATNVATAFSLPQQEIVQVTTKTVLATLLLTTLGLPLAAMAEDFTNWSLTFTNSDGSPAGSGTFRADADISGKAPALDRDITVNGVDYDFTFSPDAVATMIFNNYTGSVEGYALSSNDDGLEIPCIGFGLVDAKRWDYFLCHVSGGELKSAYRLSTYGSFTVKDADEIWRDDFDRPEGGDTVGNGWTEIERNSDSVKLTPYAPGYMVELLDVRPGEPDAAISRMISTAGYENIELVFEYTHGMYAWPNDSLKVYYTVDSGASWTLLTNLDLASAHYWTEWSGPIGAAAANSPGFGINLESDIDDEFYMNMTNPSRGARINYVVIKGTPAVATTSPEVANVTAGDVVFPADVTVTATATSAQSDIEAADYTLLDKEGKPTTWTTMVAEDGEFNSGTEGLKATLGGLSAGTYQICVRAADAIGNTSAITGDVTKSDCASFNVAAAKLGIAFIGELLNMDGDATQLTAQLAGPDSCAMGAQVFFSAILSDDEYWESESEVYSDDSGLARLSADLPLGIHEINVEVGDQYNDGEGDSVPECSGSADTGITVVTNSRASSTGGGWYKVEGLAPPRVNFGYTAQTKYNKKLGEYSTSGNVLWMHQDNYRLKGTINAGGKLPDESCPEDFAACAAFAGEGTLYLYNEAYDPECVGDYCEPEWINAIPNNPFIFFVNDGGVIEECLNKKKCKEVEQPDQFGIEIAIEALDAESEPVYLNGGNLVVR
jgi:hypothetical protein